MTGVRAVRTTLMQNALTNTAKPPRAALCVSPGMSRPAKTLRLCVVINTLSVGGAETQLLRLCRALRGTEVEVTIVSFDSHGSRCELREPFEQAVDRLIVVDRDRIGRAKFVWQLSRFFRDEQFDVVHCWHGTANQYGGLAAVLGGCRCVLTGFRNCGIDPAPVRWFDRWIGAFTVLRVANSFAIRDKHARTSDFPIDKLVVLHNGLDPAEFAQLPPRAEIRPQLGFDDNRPLLLTVGRLVPVKQMHVFVDAASRLTAAGHDLQFGIVGDGPALAALQEHVDRLRLGGRVRFLGKRHDVPAVISCATLTVCTSESEGLPNVVLESMMAGVPVITTDNGGGPELVGNPAQVVPVGDAKALADRVAACLADPAILREWAERGTRRAHDEFSVAASARNYVRILYDALARAR